MTAAVGIVEDASHDSGVRLRAGRARLTLVRAGLFGCAALIAALALAAAFLPAVPLPAEPAPVAVAAPPVWIAIDRPLQLFTLAGSPFGRLRLDYQARRKPDGSARQDTLTFGSFAAPTPYLRLSLERSRSGSEAPPDFVVAAARIAAGAGVAVVRAGQPDALASRFGLFAVAPVTLRAAGDERACLAFRLEDRPAVAIAGVACGAQGRPPEQADLACALDRLDLAMAGEDVGLRAFFGTAGRREAGCASPVRS